MGQRSILVIMGVCGCGKTVIGRDVARRLGYNFIEGDDYHPPGNVAKMRAGTALTDDDRRPWLEALGRRIAEAHAAGDGLVVSCSALKRRYRDILRGSGAPVHFVHLAGPRALIARRMQGRSGHFMPASLIDSQFAALEPPDAGESAETHDIALAPDVIAARVASGIP
jgi:gluconokinase